MPTDEKKIWYIHKHEVALRYGGPEEGGWWFELGVPVDDWYPMEHSFGDEEVAYQRCREFNANEKIRAKEEEDYEYSSVLAYRSNHYSYSVEDTPVMEVYPRESPHYE